jgi:hypothetical protein
MTITGESSFRYSDTERLCARAERARGSSGDGGGAGAAAALGREEDGMEWGWAERYTIEEMARLAGGDQNQRLQPDALEPNLGIAEEVRGRREAAEGLRLRLGPLTAALLEEQRVGCRSDGESVCGVLALV